MYDQSPCFGIKTAVSTHNEDNVDTGFCHNKLIFLQKQQSNDRRVTVESRFGIVNISRQAAILFLEYLEGNRRQGSAGWVVGESENRTTPDTLNPNTKHNHLPCETTDVT